MPILQRARLRCLTGFLKAVLSNECKDLSFRDPTGIQVEWEIATIPWPAEA
jgi:hypothetical protein